MVGKLGPRSKQRAVLRRLGCEVVFPLTGHQQLLGLLLLTGRSDNSHLTAADFELLQPYMGCLATTLENIHLRAQLASEGSVVED